MSAPKPLPGWSCTKKQMLEWLQKTDTPDDAELTLGYDEGCFKLWWRWSYLAGAFGDDFVAFTRTESAVTLSEVIEQGQA